MYIIIIDEPFFNLRSIQAQTLPERPMCTQQAKGIELRSLGTYRCALLFSVLFIQKVCGYGKEIFSESYSNLMPDFQSSQEDTALQTAGVKGNGNGLPRVVFVGRVVGHTTQYNIQRRSLDFCAGAGIESARGNARYLANNPALRSVLNATLHTAHCSACSLSKASASQEIVPRTGVNFNIFLDPEHNAER